MASPGGKWISYFNNLNIYVGICLEVLPSSLTLIKSSLMDKWRPLQVVNWACLTIPLKMENFM